MAISNDVGSYKQMSASANVKPSSGVLLGIFVSSASGSPTLAVYDSASTGTSAPIVAQWTPVAATFYPIPTSYASGLYVAIGGTVQCTVIYA